MMRSLIDIPNIVTVKRLNGYEFIPDCMIGFTNGLKPQRD